MRNPLNLEKALRDLANILNAREGMMGVGTRVGYVGPTITKPWLPRGTEGVITDIFPGTPFPYIVSFPVRDGEDWPMAKKDLEEI